jgi:hypothetical protein
MPAPAQRDLPVSYAHDDGVPFPGWAPPALEPVEAAAGYEAGERFAVLLGDPVDPQVALVLDRRNGRAVLTDATNERVTVLSGRAEALLVPAELRVARTPDDTWLLAQKGERLRVLERPHGAPLWTRESLARQPEAAGAGVPWPAWEDWTAFVAAVDNAVAPWLDLPEVVDADGWLLEVLDELDVAGRWRELTRKHDAPRVAGTRPEVLARLAEPRGWTAHGRRWRREDRADAALVRSDCAFSTGAGGAGEVTLGIEQGPVAISLTLAAATARLETMHRGAPGAPAYPRPSTGTQVAATAVLDLAGEVHEAVVAAVEAGTVPRGWEGL